MTRTVNKQVKLNGRFHPESMWGGIKERLEEYYDPDYAYEQARREWRAAQIPSVIESLAAEYRNLRKEGIPHQDIDQACYDGYLEYQYRWPVKSRKMRDEVAMADDPDAVYKRRNKVQPNDEVIKGDEAIEPIPDPLPDRNDDSIIAADLMRDIVMGMV